MEEELSIVQDECKPTTYDTTACPKLIPQAVFDNLIAIKLIDGELNQFEISQRDCVENLVRNTFNLSFLYYDGSFRPGIQSKQCRTVLGRFYESFTDSERISDCMTTGRAWLDATVGFESFGVEYDPLQGNREVLTGIDNILSLMEAMTYKSGLDASASIDQLARERICEEALESIRSLHEVSAKGQPRATRLANNAHHIKLYSQ